MELGDDKTAKGGIAFLVGLGVFELALEKRLPVSEAVRVAQFLFSKRLDLLKKKKNLLLIFLMVNSVNLKSVVPLLLIQAFFCWMNLQPV